MPNPLGGDLLQAKPKFSKSKAVVASFQRGVERAVKDADVFAETLAELWASKELRTDRSVVWSVRRATGGTVVVSDEGDNELDVMADSALLGPAGITLGGLSAGVTFGAERKATWKASASGVDLVIWARLLKLDARTAEAVDAFGFEPGAPELRAHIADVKPVGQSTDEVLAQLAE